MGLTPVLGRFPGAGHGNPLQYSSLENPQDRGAWRATVHGVAESDTAEHTCRHVYMLIPNLSAFLSTQGVCLCPDLHSYKGTIILEWTVCPSSNKVTCCGDPRDEDSHL